MSDELPPIAPVLQSYGAESVPEDGWEGSWRKMRCPFHDDRNASSQTDGVGFRCFTENLFYANAFVLIVEREGVTFDEARDRVAEILGDSNHGVPSQSRPGTYIPRRSGGAARDRSFLPARGRRPSGARA